MTAPAWLKSTPVAHRGLHDPAAGIPENSLAAFTAAIAGGYAFELDVRLSRDGIAIVFHDGKLKRLTGRPGTLEDHTAADLAKLTLLGTGETIPSLAEVLALTAGRAPVLIEVKAFGFEAVGPLEAAVARALDGYKGPFAVQSFSPQTVAWFERQAPDFCRGQIATDPAAASELPPERQQARARQIDQAIGAPHFVAYDVRYLPAPLTERARRDGLPVLTWTVRSAQDWQRARRHADNPIFEGWRP